MILAIQVLVDQMQNALTGNVVVLPNTLEIHMRPVVLNVSSTPIAVVTRLAYATNVAIHVQARVAKELDVKLLITFPRALVPKVTQEIHSCSVESWIQYQR